MNFTYTQYVSKTLNRDWSPTRRRAVRQEGRPGGQIPILPLDLPSCLRQAGSLVYEGFLPYERKPRGSETNPTGAFAEY